MTIVEAKKYIKSLEREGISKSELKVYTKFQEVLLALEQKELSDVKIAGIEQELDRLNLKQDTENKKRYMRKKYNALNKYLLKELSLVTDGYYTSMGLALGMSFGVAFGSAFGQGTGISIGISVGMVLGLSIGKSMDNKAAKENRVLKTK